MSTDTQVLDRPVSDNVVQPQGSLNKEKEAPTNPNLSEFIRPVGSELTPNLSSEEQEAGVEVRNDKPDLTFAHKELGLDHAGPHIPVPTTSSNSIQHTMSEEEIRKQKKEGQDDDSGTWFAALWEKIIAWGSKPR